MTRTERNLAASADPPARRKLPIGIQTFRQIREYGGYYVDKTPFIRRLVEGGKHYLIGVEFSKEIRNVTAFEAETA